MATRSDLFLAVAARSTDPQFFKGLGHLPNPDVVLRKLGRREEVFEELLADSHVLSVVTARKSAVLSREILVRATSGRRDARKAAELVEAAFEALDMRAVLTALLDAPMWGRAYAEVMWARRGDRLLPIDVVGRPQRRFVYGEEGELRVLTKTHALSGEPVPDRKVLQARSLATDDNPYGVAALSACYWPWVFKHNGWKWWAIFAERYGMPWIVGETPRGASQEEIAAMDEALARAVQDASFRIPTDAKVSLLEAAGTRSSDIYQAFCGAANAEISKAVLGQTLTTEVGDTGSYAAAKVHNLVREDLADADAAVVRAALERLAGWIVELNQPGAEPPQVELVQDAVPLAWLDAIKRAREAGIPVPVAWALERVGIPDANGEPTLDGPASGVGDAGASREAEAAKSAQFAEEADALESLTRALAERTERVGRRWTAGLLEALGQSSVQRAFQEAFDGGTTPAAAVARLWIALPVNSLTTSLAEATVTAHLVGAIGAAEEMDFADEEYGWEAMFSPLPFEEAARVVERRQLMTPSQFYALTEEERGLAFAVSGVKKMEVLDGIRSDLATAIREGTTQRDFERSLTERLADAGIEPLSRRRIETIWRTNIMTAHNAGRYRQQSQPGVTKRRPIWMYDAIDDDRTRPAHRVMDGKAFAADDPIWSTWYPPNGHRCRCRVVALTRREAERRGLEVMNGREFVSRTHELDGQFVNVVPDPGFATNVGEAHYKPDLSRFPVELTRPWVSDFLAAMSPAAGPARKQLAQAGVTVEHLQDLASQSKWASYNQQLDDATKLGMTVTDLEELGLDLVERPDRVLFWWYAPARRYQVVFYVEEAGELKKVALIWDPQSGIEGLHDGYDAVQSSRRTRQAVEEI